jgi:hypothetical protein
MRQTGASLMPGAHTRILTGFDQLEPNLPKSWAKGQQVGRSMVRRVRLI